MANFRTFVEINYLKDFLLISYDFLSPFFHSHLSHPLGNIIASEHPFKSVSIDTRGEKENSQFSAIEGNPLSSRRRDTCQRFVYPPRDTLWCLRLIKDKTKAISTKWKKFKFSFAAIDTMNSADGFIYQIGFTLPRYLRRIFPAVNRGIKFSRKMENYSLQTFDERLIAFMITFTLSWSRNHSGENQVCDNHEKRSSNIKWISVI